MGGLFGGDGGEGIRRDQQRKIRDVFRRAEPVVRDYMGRAAGYQASAGAEIAPALEKTKQDVQAARATTGLRQIPNLSASELDRSLSDINTNYAGILADLGLQRAQGESEMRQGAARSALASGGMASRMLFDERALIEGIPQYGNQNPNAWLNSLLGGVGTGVGIWLGRGGLKGKNEPGLEPETGYDSDSW